MPRQRATLLSGARPLPGTLVQVDGDDGTGQITARGPHIVAEQVTGFEFSFRLSQWAENQTISMINQDPGLVAVHFGASWTEADYPELSKSEYDELFNSTETHGKRPDLLVFRRADYEELLVSRRYRDANGRSLIVRLEHTPDDERVQEMARRAVKAVEVKTSVWHATRMAHYGKPSDRIGKGTEFEGKLFRKDAKIPHIIVKQDELQRMKAWREHHDVEIMVAHLFPDASFLLDLSAAERAIRKKLIRPRESRSRTRGPAKPAFYIPYTLGETLGDVVVPPVMEAIRVDHANGEIEPTLWVEEGEWALTDAARELLNS